MKDKTNRYKGVAAQIQRSVNAAAKQIAAEGKPQKGIYTLKAIDHSNMPRKLRRRAWEAREIMIFDENELAPVYLESVNIAEHLDEFIFEFNKTKFPSAKEKIKQGKLIRGIQEIYDWMEINEVEVILF